MGAAPTPGACRGHPAGEWLGGLKLTEATMAKWWKGWPLIALGWAGSGSAQGPLPPGAAMPVPMPPPAYSAPAAVPAPAGPMGPWPAQGLPPGGPGMGGLPPGAGPMPPPPPGFEGMPGCGPGFLPPGPPPPGSGEAATNAFVHDEGTTSLYSCWYVGLGYQGLQR